MSLAKVHNFSISLDGFGTGEGLSREHPFGHADERLHEWMFETRWWRKLVGKPGGSRGVDDALVRQYDIGIGAEIMGAGKFGYPGWQDDPDWKGWWGANPPFHTPVIVLTHHARQPIEMEGGTTFHFVDASSASIRMRSFVPTRSRWHAMPPRAKACGSAEASASSATCSRRGWSITPTSWWCRSCSVAESGCGTAWKPWNSHTRSRRLRRRAA